MRDKRLTKNRLAFHLAAITFLSAGLSSFLTYVFVYNRETLNFIVLYLQIFLTFVLCSTFGSILANIYTNRSIKDMDIILNGIEAISFGDFKKDIVVKEGNPYYYIAQSVNQMAKRLSNIEIMRNDFINNFSHEFKTPISSISGFADLLKKGNISPEETQEYLDVIISEANRLANLSANILFLSKLKDINRSYPLRKYNLDEQIRQCIIMLESKWMEKNLELDIDLDSFIINAYEDLVQQLWINILNNAIKYANKTIKIQLKEQKGYVHVSFTDDGKGMDDKTIERIFDTFYQGDVSHGSEGNGIGLAIVKSVLEICHYQISVESAVGSGSCFTIIIPIKKEE